MDSFKSYFSKIGLITLSVVPGINVLFIIIEGCFFTLDRFSEIDCITSFIFFKSILFFSLIGVPTVTKIKSLERTLSVMLCSRFNPLFIDFFK